WDCNGNKWGLGAFEVKPAGFAELIESDIGSNRYVSSSRSETPDGVQFEAVYRNGQETDIVRVLKLKSPDAFKKILASNLPALRPLWSERAGVCGFWQENVRTFSWLTGSERISVVSSGLDKISEYSKRYPANCRLLDELERIAKGYSGYCGNGVVEAPIEQCEASDESACPGLCRPDCSCSLPGQNNTGVCGDFLIQTPNSDGFVESCEPPLKRDVITGQVESGSYCFVRDSLSGKIVESGYCNSDCSCIAGNITLPKCGNGNCENDENENSCPSDCIVDRTPPVITVLFPQNESNVTNGSVTYNLSVFDSFGVSICVSDTDSEGAINMNFNKPFWSLNASLSNGSHIARFACKDVSGNTVSEYVNFTVVI
ncbi:hypothetical protein D6825_01020, partial [Candidatus Woesearchaeota archaeon]